MGHFGSARSFCVVCGSRLIASHAIHKFHLIEVDPLLTCMPSGARLVSGRQVPEETAFWLTAISATAAIHVPWQRPQRHPSWQYRSRPHGCRVPTAWKRSDPITPPRSSGREASGGAIQRRLLLVAALALAGGLNPAFILTSPESAGLVWVSGSAVAEVP